MLEVNGLTKVFAKNTPNERTALNGVSISLTPGEFACVIGSNGAGKSTLLNAIAGSFYPDSGRVLLDGDDITYKKEHVRAKNIGRLFQDPKVGTAPSLTLEENLALVYSKANGRGALRLSLKNSDRERLRDMLKTLDMGLEDRAGVKMGVLSGGQRQAVTLLMATMTAPKLLLLDEHTAALDPLTAQKVMALTKSIIAEKNITAIMVTHNIGDALNTGSRTIMMEDGKIALDISGDRRAKMSPAALLEEYRRAASKDMLNDRILFSQKD